MPKAGPYGVRSLVVLKAIVSHHSTQLFEGDPERHRCLIDDQ